MERVQGTACLQADFHILIVDDHALVRRGLREFLQDFSIEDGLALRIVETGSAHEAIVHLRAAAWNLVIVDLNLPDMPGLEMLRILKSVQPTAAVLVMSIYAEEHYASRVVRAGARGYLTKDAGPQELRSAIDRLLQGEQYHHTEASADLQAGMPKSRTPCTTALPTMLSDREFEILQWIAQGGRLTDIAEELNLSIKTVSTYRSRLLMKLGFRTTADLVRYALDHQLV